MVPLKPEECLEGFAQEVLKPRDLYVLTSRVLCTFQFIISEKKLTGDYFLSLSYFFKQWILVKEIVYEKDKVQNWWINNEVITYSTPFGSIKIPTINNCCANLFSRKWIQSVVLESNQKNFITTLHLMSFLIKTSATQ